MKAVVMAGGEGSRLRPLTLDRPKPMVHVANSPVMEHIVRLLKKHGVNEVILTVHYLAKGIRDYFGAGQEFETTIHYSLTDDLPLGTAGSVKSAQAHLDEPFLVMSGDALTDFNLSALVQFHQQSGALATLAMSQVPNPLEYGVVVTDETGRVLRFQEKPLRDEALGDTVNTGIYVLDPGVLEIIPQGQPFDFSHDVFPEMLRKGMALYGYAADGYWADVGTIDEYRRANADAVTGKTGIDLPDAKEGLMVGDGTVVHPKTRFFGDILLGRHCQLGEGVEIRGPTVIGDCVVVDTEAQIDQSILLANSYVGRGAKLNSCVIGAQSTVGEGADIEEAVVLGDKCRVGKRCTVKAAVKVWPNTRIDDGTIVTEALDHGLSLLGSC